MNRSMMLFVPVLVAGCAQVVVTPLLPDGSPAPNQAKGVRYYMPQPYLLVTQLPGSDSASNPDDTSSNGGASSQGRSTGRSPATTPSSNSQNKSPDDSTAKPPTTTAASTDTSFDFRTAHYAVRLIYLPDYSHPMSITENPGLFGTAEMQPALQDGWMLTSLDAKGDSKVSETIGAMAQLVASVYGGAAAGGAKAGTTATKHVTTIKGSGILTETAFPSLPPGLYALAPNASAYSLNSPAASAKPAPKLEGVLTVTPVAYFCNSGIVYPDATKISLDPCATLLSSDQPLPSN